MVPKDKEDILRQQSRELGPTAALSHLLQPWRMHRLWDSMHPKEAGTLGLALGLRRDTDTSVSLSLFLKDQFWLSFIFGDRASLCSTGCPRILYIDQADLKLKVIPLALPPKSWD